MTLFTLLVAFLLPTTVVCSQSTSVSEHSSLSFHVASGGNDNYFVRDNVTSGQLVLTCPNNTSDLGFSRLVVALPAGNSGALVYFLPQQGHETATPIFSVSLKNETFTGVGEDFNNTGIQADLSFNAIATIGVTVIGAVRAMRDYVEGGGTMHEVFNYTLVDFNSTFIQLHRKWINSTIEDPSLYRGADLFLTTPAGSTAQFDVIPGNNGTMAPPTITIIVPQDRSDNGIVRVKVFTNETNLVGLDPQELFLSPTSMDGSGASALQTALQDLSNGNNTIAEQVSFLTSQDKFTAGGWRFLTYFGRDSMIALRLLMPIMTSDAIEAALGAVIERTNSTGALCHEETIGDYASFINIENNRSDLENQPFYDYKDAKLQNGTYAQILNRTINYNLAHSNEGLGFGIFPFDVNAALVPASLRATEALINAGLISTSDIDANASEIGSIAAIWEQKSAALFKVNIDGNTAEGRLQDFVVQTNLSRTLLQDSKASNSNVVSSEVGVNETGRSVSFYALSLMEDGTPVEVLNSDLSFNLIYGFNLSQGFLQHVVDALQPYPRGLLMNIGMVVSNPAYGSNRTNIEVLDRAAYHEQSFQQGPMAGGLARQLRLCSTNDSHISLVDTNPPPSSTLPTWCNNASFVQSLTDAQTRLWASINGARDSINTEVWLYSFDNSTNQLSVADLASLSTTGTESDAIQLCIFRFAGSYKSESN
ncbi:hypothetical protein C8Q75DRAFT_794968 [Abortiporus biennis]|nr:hypothetical protein C8Q75DRAFT_794968 [Abortiporus biennis]